MKTETILLTPKKAAEFIKANTLNRPLRQHRINDYATKMKNGQWHLNHQGLAISDTGILIDGQHRCHAVVKSGVSINVLVTYGIPYSSMTTIDVGAKRSVSDAFALYSIPNSTSIAAIIQSYFNFKSEKFARASRICEGEFKSIDEKYQFYLDNDAIINEVHKLAFKCNQTLRFYSISLLASLMLYLILDKGYSISKVGTFFLGVHMAKNTTQTPSQNALYRYLIIELSSHRKISQLNKVAVTIKAWNHYIKSSNIKLVKYDPSREELPKFN